MKPINLNQIPTEYILKTKAGKLWRCGKGYRKNWAKLIGKLVLLHNTPYTLINRIKEAGKWYLIFTDGTNNYTERQDKALHNKKLAKDTIVEAAKRVIAGLLPAPKELIDQLVEQVERLVKQHNQQLLNNPTNYTTRGQLKSSIRKKLVQLENDAVTIVDKIIYISNILNTGIYAYKYITITQAKEIHKKLQQQYHPDRNNGATTELFQEIQDTFDWL